MNSQEMHAGYWLVPDLLCDAELPRSQHYLAQSVFEAHCDIHHESQCERFCELLQFTASVTLSRKTFIESEGDFPEAGHLVSCLNC